MAQASAKFKFFYGTLKFFLMLLGPYIYRYIEISKCYSYSFHQSQSNFMRTLATMVEYVLLLFLAIPIDENLGLVVLGIACLEHFS